MSGTLVLQPEAEGVDTTLSSDSTPIGSATTLQVGTSSSAKRRPLMVWDVSSVPKGAKVIKAKLTLDVSSQSVTTSHYVGVYRITRSGVTESATWDDYDGSSAWTTPGGDYDDRGHSRSALVGLTPSTIVFEDTNLVRLVNRSIRTASGQMAVLIALETELDGTAGATEWYQFYSSDETGGGGGRGGGGGDRPKLELTYTTDSIASSRSVSIRWTQISNKTHTHQRYRTL